MALILRLVLLIMNLAVFIPGTIRFPGLGAPWKARTIMRTGQ